MAATAKPLTKFFGSPLKGPATPPPAPVRPSAAETPSPPPKPGSSGRAKAGRGAAVRAAGTPPVKRGRKAAPSVANKGGAKGAKKKNTKQAAKAAKPGNGRTARWGLLMKSGLKAPKTSYTLWANDNRERIQKELGTSQLILVAKAAAQEWNRLSDEEKAPYVARQKELSAKFMEVREAYNEYAKKRTSKKDLARAAAQVKKSKAKTQTTQKPKTQKTLPPVSQAPDQAQQVAQTQDSMALALDPSQLSASLLATQPEVGISRPRRAFKIPVDEPAKDMDLANSVGADFGGGAEDVEEADNANAAAAQAAEPADGMHPANTDGAGIGGDAEAPEHSAEEAAGADPAATQVAESLAAAAWD